MKNSISIREGDVVGIGKLKVFTTDSFQHEIPMLSFIVAKTKDGDFISTCIQLQIDGDGATPNAASENMRRHCVDFLHTLFTNEKTHGHEWDNLHELFTDENTELWNVYRDVQLNLAEKGICTDINQNLRDRIAELEKMIADLKAMIDAKSETFEAKVIEYEEVAA